MVPHPRHQFQRDSLTESQYQGQRHLPGLPRRLPDPTVGHRRWVLSHRRRCRRGRSRCRARKSSRGLLRRGLQGKRGDATHHRLQVPLQVGGSLVRRDHVIGQDGHLILIPGSRNPPQSPKVRSRKVQPWRRKSEKSEKAKVAKVRKSSIFDGSGADP